MSIEPTVNLAFQLGAQPLNGYVLIFGGSEVEGYTMLLMDEDMSEYWDLSKQQPIPGCLCQQSSLATKSIIYACGLNKHEGEFK